MCTYGSGSEFESVCVFMSVCVSVCEGGSVCGSESESVCVGVRI